MLSGCDIGIILRFVNGKICDNIYSTNQELSEIPFDTVTGRLCIRSIKTFKSGCFLISVIGEFSFSQV